MGKRSRSRVWIDNKIQGALAFRVIIHWGTFVIVVAVLTLAMQYVATPFAAPEELMSIVWQNQGPFLIVMLILLPIFLYDTVKLSNRFAGPVVRLRRAMQDASQGKPIEKIQFREGDFWRGLAEDFNKLVERGYFEQEISTNDAATPDKPAESDLQEVS